MPVIDFFFSSLLQIHPSFLFCEIGSGSFTYFCFGSWYNPKLCQQRLMKRHDRSRVLHPIWCACSAGSCGTPLWHSQCLALAVHCGQHLSPEDLWECLWWHAAWWMAFPGTLKDGFLEIPLPSIPFPTRFGLKPWGTGFFLGYDQGLWLFFISAMLVFFRVLFTPY